MTIDLAETADPTRRALLAALAGGFATATATTAAGKKGSKGKKKPKPPLVAAFARTDQVARLNDVFVVLVGGEALDLRTDPIGGFSLSFGIEIPGGTVEQMRSALVRAVADAVGDATDNAPQSDRVPPDRVAVLFL